MLFLPQLELDVPEGPEIRRAADRVAAALEGRQAHDVFFAFDRLKPLQQATVGGRKVFWCPGCQPVGTRR